jgi:uncharacterized Zn-finger protein
MCTFCFFILNLLMVPTGVTVLKTIPSSIPSSLSSVPSSTAASHGRIYIEVARCNVLCPVCRAKSRLSDTPLVPLAMYVTQT